MPQDVDLSSCVQCGSPLPPRARFCPECGTPTGAIATGIAVPFKSSPSALPAERRPVAIMFADLCGYTELSSTLDPEEMHRVLGRYFELIDAVVVRFGGSIDKHVGDAVMAVFGAPVAHGNDVERAVRAGCEVHNAMRTLAAELGRPLAAHVGIASGEVVAAATGSAAHREYTMTGDAVNLAARLEELAGAGQTMVSDEVYRALANRLDAVSSGAVLVRGLRDPVPVWPVRAIRVSRAAGVPLIGREAEVQRFSSIIGRVNEQRVGATALLRADPGLGKTRLAEEFLSLAESMGFACHTAVVLDFGTGRGRDAVTGLVCSLLGVALDSDDAARHLALERALERRLIDADQKPFAAELLGLSQHAGTLYEAMDNAERVQGKLRTLCGLIERSSAVKPRLLMVEDVHWATPWILDCLAETAAVAERSLAVLLLTSRRDGDPVAAGWPLGNIERFDLEPLSASDALALAQAFAPTGQDHVKRCIERAQGNPLFLTQLLQADPEGDAVPATIQSVVLARLDRLPLPEKRALQAASVIGQRFSLDLLRYMLRDDAYNPTTALASELIRVDGARAEQMSFAHALIRDGAYASLLHSTRRELHCAAAQWFRGRDASLVAEHLDRAEDPGAAQAYLDAAQAEAAALRIDAALRLARRGQELANAAASVRAALAALEGDLLRDTGAPRESVLAFERALALSTDERGRCLALIGIAAAHRVTAAYDASLLALDQAEPIALGLGLHRELSRICYLRGSLDFGRGDVVACNAKHERALDYARRAADRECEAHALSGLADGLYAQGRMRAAYEAFRRCVAVCDAAGLTRFAIMNRAMAAIITSFLGEPNVGLAELAKAGATARQVRHLMAEVMVDEVTGWLLVSSGRYPEAASPLARSLLLARQIGAKRFESMILMLQAHVLRHRGETLAAADALREAWALCEETGTRFAGPIVLGAMALTAATPEARRKALADGEALLANGCPAHSHFWFYRDAIEAMLESHAWDEAERYATELERFSRIEPAGWFDIHVERARALAEAGRGKGDRHRIADCRERALAYGLGAALPALDAALAR